MGCQALTGGIMRGTFVISLIPRDGYNRYTIFECTTNARTEVEKCTTLDEALRRVKEIRASEKKLFAQFSAD
jgi:hypothetical protein